MSFKCRFATLDEAYLKQIRKDKIQEQMKNKAEQQAKIYKEKVTKYIEKYGKYWQHPEIKNYTCLIPISIKAVPCLDYVNSTMFMILDNGEYQTLQTEVYVLSEGMTEKEYISKYCKLLHKNTNIYIYTGVETHENSDICPNLKYEPLFYNSIDNVNLFNRVPDKSKNIPKEDTLEDPSGKEYIFKIIHLNKLYLGVNMDENVDDCVENISDDWEILH